MGSRAGEDAMTVTSSLLLVLLQVPLLQTEKTAVSGIVRTADGKPASGVRVAAMVAPEPGLSATNATALVSLTNTDESGRYRLDDVPSGRYYIVAGRVDAPTYYPGVQRLPALRLSLSREAGVSLMLIL
jgi:hypothetical protein